MSRYGSTPASIHRITSRSSREPPLVAITGVWLSLVLCVFKPHTVHTVKLPVQATSQFNVGLDAGGDIVYGTFIYYTNLACESFIASPLVSPSNGMTLGVMLAWIFKRNNN